jgi:hypothetical protein
MEQIIRHNATDDDKNCPVCSTPIVDKAMILPCRHHTCFPCVSQWISKDLDKSSCPFCRREIIKVRHTPTIVETVSNIRSTTLLTDELKADAQRALLILGPVLLFCEEVAALEARGEDAGPPATTERALYDEGFRFMGIWEDVEMMNESVRELRLRTENSTAVLVRDRVQRLYGLREDLRQRLRQCQMRLHEMYEQRIFLESREEGIPQPEN